MDKDKEVEKRILYNAIQTPDGTVISSKHRHDYNTYTDKNGQHYSVDGGVDYLRRGFDKPDYTDVSVYDDGTHETRRNYICWGVNYTKDMVRLPETRWEFVKNLNIDHIQAIVDGEYAKGFMLEVFKEELNYRKKNGKV